MAMPRVAVLISGRGSNLAAVLAAERAGVLSGTVAAVISNRPEAAGLAAAARHGAAVAAISGAERHRGRRSGRGDVG